MKIKREMKKILVSLKFSQIVVKTLSTPLSLKLEDLVSEMVIVFLPQSLTSLKVEILFPNPNKEYLYLVNLNPLFKGNTNPMAI